MHLILWNVGCNQFSVSVRNGKSAKIARRLSLMQLGEVRPAADGGRAAAISRPLIFVTCKNKQLKDQDRLMRFGTEYIPNEFLPGRR